MCRIRPATREDLPALIEMGRQLHDESPRYQGMEFKPAKLERLFDSLQGTLLAQPGCVFVAERGDYIIGMTVGIIAERWFSDELYLTDLTMFVRPEHRGGSAFPKLVRALEGWAASEKITEIALGVSTEIHAQETSRMYERLGYRLAGYTMVKHNGN